MSHERYEADETTIARLCDWPFVLMRQPGWRAHIEPSLHLPHAWPSAWHRASEMGFEPMAHHHHALLFGRMAERAIADDEFELALWTWRESLSAWRALLSEGDYMLDLITALTHHDSTGAEEEDQDDTREDEEMAGESDLSSLLTPLIHTRALELRDDLHLGDGLRDDEVLDGRRIRFCWSALTMTEELFGQGDDPLGVMAHTARAAKEAKREVVFSLVARLERMVESLDLTSEEGTAPYVPFEWIASVSRILGHFTSVSTRVIELAVSTAWKIDKLGHDERSPHFSRLLDVCAPFNIDLRRRIGEGEAFGHNSSCADFLVFEAERLDLGPQRKEILSRAVTISPGHRNASMLLSYEYLAQANTVLSQLRLLPSSIRFLPGQQRPSLLLSQAKSFLARVESIYPPNESLAEYTEKLEREAARFGIDLDTLSTTEADH